jgi:predicted transcriptional regulator
MGRIVQVYIDDDGEARLDKIAAETGRTFESLVESAAEEAALDYFRHRPLADDPAKASRERRA